MKGIWEWVYSSKRIETEKRQVGIAVAGKIETTTKKAKIGFSTVKSTTNL